MKYVRALLQGLTLVIGLSGCSSTKPEATNDLNFIRQKPTDGPQMAALLEGDLVLSERCLRLASSGGSESHAAIWPFGYSSAKDGEGVMVFNAERQVVAQVGDTIRVGGGEVPHPSDEVFAQYYIGDAQCPGKYWIVAGDVEVIAP